jgi:hypothetical protein
MRDHDRRQGDRSHHATALDRAARRQPQITLVNENDLPKTVSVQMLRMPRKIIEDLMR